MISGQNKTRQKEAGVTLLLSILVLSAITAISFSLATIVFIEIRSSGDLQRTEPALYATQGVIEMSIFKVQREVPDSKMCFDASDISKLSPATSQTQTSCQSNTQIKSNVNMVVISSVATQDIDDSPISEVVPSSYNTLENTKNIYSIYDAQNPNNPQAGYTKLVLENPSATNNLRYSFCVVNEPSVVTPIDCSPSSYPNSSWKNYDAQLLPLQNVVFALQKNYIYKLYLYVPLAQTTAGYANIYSYGPASVSDNCTGGGGAGECAAKGLPLKGKKRVDVTAENSGLTRRYRVLVPLSQ